MLTLALDTSTPAGSLAVLYQQKVIGVVSSLAEETYSSRMFRHLEFLLAELSLTMERFDLYAVAAGPGSFTGLRVGLAAVKGWAEVYRKPIAAVSTLEAVARQAHSAADLLVPVLDARRGEIYFGFYRRRGKVFALEGEECSMVPDEFAKTVQQIAQGSGLAIVTPVPELVVSAMSRFETPTVPVEEVGMILAPTVGQIGLERAKCGETMDALQLDANYVRRSDAEVKWKKPARA